jgi:long-subunit acyl-CoA synthetase (AMP-forming)
MSAKTAGLFQTNAATEETIQTGDAIARFYEIAEQFKEADVIFAEHRFFISGGAALEKEIAKFFWAAGLPVYEGYGLTETSPVISLNGPGVARFGSVGRVLGGQELRIAEDGEILVRGPNVMTGYYKMESETAQALRRACCLRARA